jgi:hypothetical protein
VVESDHQASQRIQQILTRGARMQQGSHAEAVNAERGQAPTTTPTIH